jgi:orotate phosphoribosyltransferase
VGYAGTYDKEKRLHWVGEVYANIAVVEENPHILQGFASQMIRRLVRAASLGLASLRDIDGFCGAPLGGYAFAQALGLASGRRVIKAEKEVLAVATERGRAQTRQIFGRHQPRPGEKLVIVEDVCNNLSSVMELIDLIGQYGAPRPSPFVAC